MPTRRRSRYTGLGTIPEASLTTPIAPIPRAARAPRRRALALLAASAGCVVAFLVAGGPAAAAPEPSAVPVAPAPPAAGVAPLAPDQLACWKDEEPGEPAERKPAPATGPKQAPSPQGEVAPAGPAPAPAPATPEATPGPAPAP